MSLHFKVLIADHKLINSYHLPLPLRRLVS
jgi:hypothetical protein